MTAKILSLLAEMIMKCPPKRQRPSIGYMDDASNLGGHLGRQLLSGTEYPRCADDLRRRFGRERRKKIYKIWAGFFWEHFLPK